MQLAHATDLAQQAVAECQTVLDLCGGAHVEQGALHLAVLHAQVHTADHIGLVFFLCHPAGGGAGGATLAERKHARALRPGGIKSIGVDADQQVRLHALGFLHTHMQGHKKVGVACQKSPHGVVSHAAGVDAFAQHFGDLEHHVFFAGATRANGTWVLSAVTRVECDHDQAVGAGLCG